MTALSKARETSAARLTAAYQRAEEMKQAGALDFSGSDGGVMGALYGGANPEAKRQYARYRGWVYSAIHATALEGAAQPVYVGILEGAAPRERDERRHPGNIKAWMRMPASIKAQVGRMSEYDIQTDHELLDVLEEPNEIQSRWEFVYSFIANLCLTGWSFIVGGEKEGGGIELYSLPTTWVKPLHKEGPFSHFIVRDPEKPPTGDEEPLPKENVGFAYFPNPMDPRKALAPASAQLNAIQIDDHIQTSQNRFYENGIFPGSIVEIGKDPHPQVAAGIRPRLTGAQRRQVIGSIRKVLGGVANMGNPAIVDGLIENIRPFSFSSREMGWEKSEDKVADRILSAFGTHKFILGMEVGVGGYAQAFVIQERFYKRVNTFLDLLTNLANNFVVPLMGGNERLCCWWEELEATDPQIQSKLILAGRNNGDITRDEFRAMIGLSDLSDDDERALKSAGFMQNIVLILDRLYSDSSNINEEAAKEFLILFGVGEAQAERMVQGAEAARASGRELNIAEELAALVQQMKEPVKLVN